MGKKTLSGDALAAGMAKLFEWSVKNDGKTIEKTYEFKSFNSAFGFMARAALKAEQLDHHPDWSNSYNKVSVSLSTHSAGGVTDLDLELAAFMDSIA